MQIASPATLVCHLIAIAGSIAIIAVASPAPALDTAADEEAKLKACERDICTMILLKKKKGGDLTCTLSKTWAGETLKEGGDNKVSWLFGDAQCSTNVEMSRADIIAALTRPKHAIILRNQKVACTVERNGEAVPVAISLSPKLKFEKGRADKFWINLKELEGPADVKSTVWTAAHLQDSLGLFHSGIIRSVNKFIYRKCAKSYAKELGLPKPGKRRPKKKRHKNNAARAN